MSARKEEIVKSGLSAKQAALALLVMAAGVIGIFLSIYYNWSIVLGKSFRLPYWVLTVIAGGLVAYGSYSLYLAFSALKCIRCAAEFENAEVSFRKEDKDAVKTALLTGDYRSLENIPAAHEYGDSTTLELQFCPSCRYAALLTLDHVVSWNPKSVLGERVVSGSGISDLIRIAKNRAAED